jgi:uncharacterized protein (DUF4415 family)
MDILTRQLKNDISSNFSEANGSETRPRANSRTHWERLDALADEEIDMSDIPPLTDEDFARSEWRLPAALKPILPAETAPVIVKVAVDKDILAWFQAQGQDYQARMRAALRLYAEAHQASALSVIK